MMKRQSESAELPERRAALLLYQILSETQVILWYNGCIGWRRTKEYTRVIDKRTVIYGSHKFYIRIGYRRSSGGADDIFTKQPEQ